MGTYAILKFIRWLGHKSSKLAGLLNSLHFKLIKVLKLQISNILILVLPTIVQCWLFKYWTLYNPLYFIQTFSLLAQLSADDLEGNNVVYHNQPDAPVCLASGLKKADKGLSLACVFVVTTESGQIHLLRMPLKGRACLYINIESIGLVLAVLLVTCWGYTCATYI